MVLYQSKPQTSKAMWYQLSRSQAVYQSPSIGPQRVGASSKTIFWMLRVTHYRNHLDRC